MLLDNTARSVIELLNEKGRHIVNGRSLHSPRAVGDAIQEFLGEQNGLRRCIPQNMLQSFENDFERRSMEDMAFYDVNHRYFGRKTWMLQLCDYLDTFYDEEIYKIEERKLWFKDIKEYWKQK